MKEQHFVLYACCIPVKGYTRSLVCDVQRGGFKFIPNELYEILVDEAPCDVTALKKKYPESDHGTIDEYFEYLESHEYGFWTNNPEKFPAIDLSYKTPSTITNAIIDLDKHSDHDFEAIFDQLEYLGCKEVQVRAYDTLGIKEIRHIMKLLAGRKIRAIDWVLKYSPADHEQILALTSEYNRISAITLHSGFENKVLNKGFSDMGRIMMVKQTVSDETHCGQISPIYFSLNLTTFTEAKNFNSCLNQKISIDKQGNIKNCPSMATTYGNHQDTKLAKVVQNEAFRAVWDITKDKVSGCQDCEFRYICTDCRAYTQDSQNPYAKPAKCDYDPYTGVWQ